MVTSRRRAWRHRRTGFPATSPAPHAATCADVLHALADVRGDLGEVADALAVNLCPNLRCPSAPSTGASVVSRVRQIFSGRPSAPAVRPDRETPLKFRNQIRGLGHVECAGGNEQDGRSHRVVLWSTRWNLHQWQQIALHAFAADIGLCVPARRQTLSISSMKTMPFCSTLLTACSLMSPSLTSFLAASSSISS